MKYTVILNAYKRLEVLEEQIQSYENQSIKPNDIVVWNNTGGEINLKNKDIKVFGNGSNTGVWSRFLLPLTVNSDYYNIVDDDTIPGRNWIENCLKSYSEDRGLYGTIGVIFKKLGYVNNERYGWDNPNEDKIEVDIVGHSWFFDYEMIRAYWSVKPISNSPYAGEDIHFSYSIQKVLGLKTYVPPHPKKDVSMWGADHEKSWKIGTDKNAISHQNNAMIKFENALRYYLSLGFKLKQVNTNILKSNYEIYGTPVFDARNI